MLIQHDNMKKKFTLTAVATSVTIATGTSHISRIGLAGAATGESCHDGLYKMSQKKKKDTKHEPH